MVAVLAAILDKPCPWQAGLNRLPHVPESLGRHIRMTDQVVWLAHELLALKAADMHKCMVAVSDPPLQIGDRYEGLVGRERKLTLTYWKVVTHG